MTVNAACPTAKENGPGAYAATRTTTGSTAQRAAESVPIASSRSAPTTKPAVVPNRARIAVDPVDMALVRSTDSAASTTQKPCCTLLRSATATAPARARDPRALLMNHVERRLVWRRAMPAYLDTPVS